MTRKKLKAPKFKIGESVAFLKEGKTTIGTIVEADAYGAYVAHVSIAKLSDADSDLVNQVYNTSNLNVVGSTIFMAGSHYGANNTFRRVTAKPPKAAEAKARTAQRRRSNTDF